MEQELFFNFLCRKQLLGQVNRVYCQLAAAICRVLRSSSVWGQIRRNSGGIRRPPKASTITPALNAEKVGQESFQRPLKGWFATLFCLLESFKWFSVFFLPVVWPGRHEKSYELIEVGRDLFDCWRKKNFLFTNSGEGALEEGLSKWVRAIREDQSHWCNVR